MINLIGEKKDLVEKLFLIVSEHLFSMPMMIVAQITKVIFNQLWLFS